MPSDAHTLYAESLARALLKANLEGEGRLFESSKEYIVTLRLGLPEPDLHGTRSLTVISSIIKDYQGWGPATPVVSTIYSPHSGKFSISFPVPIASEQYFPESARKQFLHDYTVYLVAQAVRRGLAGRSDTELGDMLQKAFGDPRHPRDIAKMEARARWKSRLKRIARAIRVKRPDRLKAYR